MKIIISSKFKVVNMVLHIVIGCAVDVRGTSWIGNPCTANKIWTVAAFTNVEKATQLCEQLNKASETDYKFENLAKVHSRALPPGGWSSVEDRYEWIAIGYQVNDTLVEDEGGGDEYNYHLTDEVYDVPGPSSSLFIKRNISPELSTFLNLPATKKISHVDACGLTCNYFRAKKLMDAETATFLLDSTLATLFEKECGESIGCDELQKLLMHHFV